MISKVLIVISTIMILTGFVGAKMKAVWQKLIFLSVSIVGMLLMSFSEGNAYGVLGGTYQVLFRLISLIFLIALILSVAQRNNITKVEELRGIGKKMPYLYAMIVIYSMLVIGIPATGTFIGIFYSGIGVLLGGFGLLAYVGLLANVIGIGVAALLIFPILRQAYFPGTGVDSPKNVVKPGKGLQICSVVVLVLLVAASIYPNPVIVPVSKLFEKMFS